MMYLIPMCQSNHILNQISRDHPELNPINYGLDPTAQCNASDVLHCDLDDSHISVAQLVQKLQSLYCGTLAAEFHYIQVCLRPVLFCLFIYYIILYFIIYYV